MRKITNSQNAIIMEINNQEININLGNIDIINDVLTNGSITLAKLIDYASCDEDNFLIKAIEQTNKSYE